MKESVVTQKQVGVEEDAGVLRKEVKRLEGKVSGLSTVLEKQTKELDEVKDEVFFNFYNLFLLLFSLIS
jgi:TRAF-interacting protein